MPVGGGELEVFLRTPPVFATALYIQKFLNFAPNYKTKKTRKKYKVWEK